MRKLFLINAAVMFLFISANGSEYYVDCTNSNDGDGSPENPFKTIQLAAAQAQSGDVVHIMGGNISRNTEGAYVRNSVRTGNL